MIIPKVPCTITKYTDETDDYGQQLFSAPINSLCNVVKLETTSNATSVRTDASGSGGHAKEINAASRLLFKPETEIGENDRVEISGVSLKVIGIQIRFGVFQPKPDHLQVDLDIWA